MLAPLPGAGQVVPGDRADRRAARARREPHGAGEGEPSHPHDQGQHHHRCQRRHRHPGGPVPQRQPHPPQPGAPLPRMRRPFRGGPYRGRGQPVPGPRVHHPGQPGHGHDAGRVEARHQGRGQRQHAEAGDDPRGGPGRGKPPPPGLADTALAERHGRAEQDGHRGQVGPGERQQRHPEHQRDHRGHHQPDQHGQHRAGHQRGQEPGPRQAVLVSGAASGPGQHDQHGVHRRAGDDEEQEHAGEAEPRLVEREQPAQVVVGRERRERGDLGGERAGAGCEESEQHSPRPSRPRPRTR